MTIDIDKLRRDLIDYYGTAMAKYPAAIIDLSMIESAPPEKLVEIARKNGFNLLKYSD